MMRNIFKRRDKAAGHFTTLEIGGAGGVEKGSGELCHA